MATSSIEEEERNSRGLKSSRDWRMIRRIARLMLPYKVLVILSLVLLPLVAVAQLAQPYLLKVVIDQALMTGNSDLLGLLAIAYVVSLCVEAVLRFAQNFSTQIAGQRFMFDLRQSLFQRLLEHSASFHDRNPPGTMMTRVTTDVESLNSLFTSGVVAVCSDTVGILASSVMLFWLDWRLALFCFVAIPILVPVLHLFRQWMRHVFRITKEMLSRMNAYLAEVVAGIRVVQLFEREERNGVEFSELNRQFKDAYDKSNVYEATLFSFVEFVSRVVVAGLIWFGGRSILEGALTFGTLVAVVEYANNLFIPVRDLSAKFAILQSAMASAERIFSILDAPVEIVYPDPSVSKAGSLGAVEFDHVEFAYGSGDPVLRDMSLRIEPGEKIAVVGATGAGKSSFMKLISRFYDPTAGAIRIDGIDLRQMDKESLRKTVNVVLQDVFIFSGTVADNISLGDPSISRQRIIEAARSVNAEKFIQRLPGGYDGHLRERGNNLSIGERQLLSFARAMVLDPRILIMDEATSSVDTETEVLIQAALKKVMAGRTTIVIAHRLSTIRDANRILVLHKGCLVEEGTHKVLMGRTGIYRRLYELQYQDDERLEPGSETAPPSETAEAVPAI